MYKNLVLFTDLDGTLLDHDRYRWDAARPALEALRGRQVPLIVVTSKTRFEVARILRQLRLRAPFVVENGGAIYLPARYFPFQVPGAIVWGKAWLRVALGTPRRRLLRALRGASRRSGVRLRSLVEMSAREVAELTGLAPGEARYAQQREFDEPFVIMEADRQAWPRLDAEIHRRRLQGTRGSRFFHILGRNDKGAAVRRIASWYRRAKGCQPTTVALGDSPNDISMLRQVSVRILVARPGGRYDREVLAALPDIRRAGGVGPVGWNRAVLQLLGE